MIEEWEGHEERREGEGGRSSVCFMVTRISLGWNTAERTGEDMVVRGIRKGRGRKASVLMELVSEQEEEVEKEKEREEVKKEKEEGSEQRQGQTRISPELEVAARRRGYLII